MLIVCGIFLVLSECVCVQHSKSCSNSLMGVLHKHVLSASSCSLHTKKKAIYGCISKFPINPDPEPYVHVFFFFFKRHKTVIKHYKPKDVDVNQLPRSLNYLFPAFICFPKTCISHGLCWPWKWSCGLCSVLIRPERWLGNYTLPDLCDEGVGQCNHLLPSLWEN